MECKQVYPDVNIQEDGKVFRDDGREYPQRKDKYGYFRITTYDKEKKKNITYLVHRLVALAFVPNPHNNKIVNHIDANKENNNISNLEWISIAENSKHAYNLGINKFTPRDTSKARRDWKGRFSK